MEILQDIANKIGFEWHLAFTSLINFLIIFFLLAKFALPSIKKTIEERTKRIKEGLSMREEADKIVQSANAEGMQITREANRKAEEIFSKVEASAKEVILDANSKASSIVALAEKEKQEAKEKGLKEAETLLTKDIGKILSKISANAFSGKLTGETNSEFISKVFKM